MTRDQVFWAVFALIALCIVSSALFWGGGLRSKVRAEAVKWEELGSDYTRLYTGRRSIPNRDSIEKWRAYKQWVKGQSEQVAAYFERRDNVLEKRLDDASVEPSPGDFKAAYNSRRSAYVRLLTQREKDMRVWNPEDVFLQYPWSVGQSNPDPSQFRRVRKDLWIRRYFALGVLPRNGVSEVSNLSVSEPLAIPDTEFVAIPVKVTCKVPAPHVTKLLQSLLAVPPGDPEKLFVTMRQMTLTKAPGPGGKTPTPVTLDFTVDVIDFEPKRE